MAIFEREYPKKVLLDDTEPLSCVIENWQYVNGHTEFVIRVQRGPFADQTWRINKRYNDFFKLNAHLQTSGIPLDFPPKKIIGNLDPKFINERQKSLEKYLNNVMMNPILMSSLPARSFVDPANYCQPFSEHALQHVSLALRGEVGWEVVGPLTEIGWRLRKHFYHLKCKNIQNVELWGSWTDYGPDKYLEDKEMQSVFKSLSQIQHPFIEPIKLCLCTDLGGLAARSFCKNGSLRDMLCKSQPKQSFLKKYGNPKGHKALEIGQVASYGRQILEALRFLHEKGLPYGHLHSGNILIDPEKDRVTLLDIENGVLGVPSYYKPYFMQHRKINNLEAIDVYCFGHTLYEMAFGSPLHESIVDQFPECPTKLRLILESILSAEGCKSGLPTIKSLISNPFFANVYLNVSDGEKVHLKISTQIKDRLKITVNQMEERLKDEQKMVRSQKRLVKVQEKMSSEEEKKKQRHKQRQEERKLEKIKQRSRESEKDKNEKANGSERSDSVNSETVTSVGTATPPSATGSFVPSPPPPPPMGGALPPPPPPAPLMTNGNTTQNPTEPASKDRSALLGAICNFNKNSLRKAGPKK